MTASVVTSTPRVDQSWLAPLDGVRGLAALWVIAAHALLLCGARTHFRGGVAVDVFMVVSGLLMAHHYMHRRSAEPWESPLTWLGFYLRRFFRIAPLYYAILALSILFVEDFEQARNQIDLAMGLPKREYASATASNWFTHLTFVFGAIPQYHRSTIPPDWSIGLEMQFYLVFPFIMLAGARLSPALLATIAVAISLVAQRTVGHQFVVPSFLPLKIHVFLIGILLAKALAEPRTRHTSRLILVLCALAICGITRSRLLTLAVCGIGAILLTPRQSTPTEPVARPIAYLRDLLGCRLASRLADISYGLYLLHLLILIPLVALLVQYKWFMDMAPLMRFALVLPVVVIATVLGSTALHHGIEQPCIACGKRLVKWVNQSRKASPVDDESAAFDEALRDVPAPALVRAQ